MELQPNDFRRMSVEEFDTTKLLAHAAQQAKERGYDGSRSSTSTRTTTRTSRCRRSSNISTIRCSSSSRSRGVQAERQERAHPATPWSAIRTWAGASRATGCAAREDAARQGPARRRADQALDGRGRRRRRVLFPTPMLALGVHPQVEVEIALSRAYNRWLCERVLAHEPRLVSMLYLPFNDPDATYEFVQGVRRARRAWSAS